METSRKLTIDDGMCLNTIGVAAVFNANKLPANISFSLYYYDGATEVRRDVTYDAERIGYNAIAESYEITKSRHVRLVADVSENIDILFYLTIYAVSVSPIC